MSKKLIVSAFAGAMLLSASAAYAAVTGVCSNCHTMHNSQNGTTAAGNVDLLKGTGCAACHDGGANTAGYSTGNTAGISAPSVTGTSIANGNAAGYFATGALTGAANSLQHNVVDLSNDGDELIINGGNTVPGGTGAPVTLGTVTTADLACADCHTNGGHHTAGSYRMLPSAVTTISVGAATFGFGGVRNPTAATYNATEINGVCNVCHTDFHTASGTYDVWQRHPVNIALTDAGITDAASKLDTTFAGSDAVPMGRTDGDATENYVMCISCHLPHGGPYADLLGFDYAVNSAGTAGNTDGCEGCHNPSGTGM